MQRGHYNLPFATPIYLFLFYLHFASLNLALPFQQSIAVPMVWHERSNHATDCYFCLVETNVNTKKTRHNISYPNLPLAILPVPHSELYPVPVVREQSPLQGVPFQVSEESPGDDTELSYTQVQIGNQIDVGTDSSCLSSESDSDYSKGLSSYVSQSVPPSYEQI